VTGIYLRYQYYSFEKAVVSACLTVVERTIAKSAFCLLSVRLSVTLMIHA